MKYTAIMLWICIHLFNLMYSQEENNKLVRIVYNQNKNLLEIKICTREKIEIDKNLWLFNNQYPKSESYFLLDVFEDNQQIFPKALDILITPEEGFKILKKENIISFDDTKGIYLFTIVDKDILQTQAEVSGKNSPIYFYSFKKGKKYKMQIQLKVKSKIYKSNIVEFIY